MTIFRGLLGLIGVGLLGLAAYWGYVKTPAEAVILAVLGVGTLLLYLSYSGQLLTGLKAGGVEATLADVVRAVASPDVPGEVQKQIAEIVGRGQAPVAVRQQVRKFSAAHKEAVTYENKVANALGRLAATKPWIVERLGSGGPFDFMITDDTARTTVRVECRWSAETPDGQRIKQWINKVKGQSGAVLGMGILLVVSDLPSGSSGPGVVKWSRDTEDGDLGRAIERALI